MASGNAGAQARHRAAPQAAGLAIVAAPTARLVKSTAQDDDKVLALAPAQAI